VYNDYVTDNLHVGAILYHETWPVSNNVSDSLGSVTWNDKPGSFAEFHFVGNHISYYARKGPEMGKVDVYLDNKLVLNDYDLYANSTITKSLIYTNDNLVNTTHTLRIENTGLKNAIASGNYVNIDFLIHRLGDYIVSPNQGGDVLPVNLIRFHGRAEQDKVRLTWNTTNEVNNSYFEVLRVEPGNTYKTIGRVNAKIENSRGPNDYFLYDNAPNKGANYYQLKQYDIDGTFTLSKIVAVDMASMPQFSVYPNPVRQGEIIRIKAANPDIKMDVQLIDINSRIVAQRTFDRVQDTIEWPTVGLAPGVYILRIKTSLGQFAHRIVVIP
jgi:hypothetical protein